MRYGDVTAVDDIGFDIAPGEMVTLLGPSGCGKTTTLRAVAGLETPSGGSIRLNGETVYSASERRNVPAEKRGVSMVFQSYAIWPHMTVFDNVAYGLRVRKLPAAEVRENVQRVLGLVQMQAFADRPASKLSGGQQQRVAVARAIAFSPSVLLFDEPLSNLDAKLRAEMRVELRELQRRLDITSLYVTHDQEEALAISDQGDRDERRPHRADRHSGRAIAHPSQLRAIPNNAILQQLGFMAVTLYGIGRAVSKDPELFQAMRQRSARFGRSLQIVSPRSIARSSTYCAPT